MRIGIFGGAFNPPHIGHTNAVKSAIIQNNLDKVYIIPTGVSPHKEMPHGSPSPDIRLEMTKNAFEGIHPAVIISDIEIFSKDSNYTIDTVKVLHKKYPGAEFYLLLGDDMYNSLDTWKDSEALLRLATPVMLPRDVVNISSTQVRNYLARRLGREYICENNYSLIIKGRIYDARPDWDWLRDSAYAMLEPKRIAHVRGTEQAAVRLAEHWGENTEDAREAAILHDITKKLDFDENMCIIADNGLKTDTFKKEDEKLLHSVTASLIAKTVYGVSDNVANAILLHTTGAASMSMLDKIIYLADYIEPTRNFPGVDELRKQAYSNINTAMITGLQMVIDDLSARGITINKSTYEAISKLRDSDE